MKLHIRVRFCSAIFDSTFATCVLLELSCNFSISELLILTRQMLHCKMLAVQKWQLRVLSFEFNCTYKVDMIGWFPDTLNFNVVGSISCLFLSQNTAKGRLTHASKERCQLCVAFLEVRSQSEDGIPLLRRARLAKKHGEEAPFAGMQRTDFWDWSQHHVVSGHRTLGTSTERRQMAQDSHVGLATGVAERLSFVEMPQLLALQ